MHLPGCEKKKKKKKKKQKSGAFHIRFKKNRVSHILFVEKRGLIIYLAALKMGAIQHTHLDTHPYYVIYRKLTTSPTELKILRTSLLSLLCMIEMPAFALL